MFWLMLLVQISHLIGYISGLCFSCIRPIADRISLEEKLWSRHVCDAFTFVCSWSYRTVTPNCLFWNCFLDGASCRGKTRKSILSKYSYQLILHRIPVYNKFLVFERTVVRIDMTLIMIVRKIRFVWLMLPDREVVSRECFDFFPRPQTIRAHRHRRLSQQLWNKVDVLKQLAYFPRSTLLFTWSNVFFVPLKPPKHCHRLFLSNTILQSAIKIFGE